MTILDSMGVIVVVCIVCDEEKENGIHLFTHFICETCEQNIRLTEPEDELYRYYLQKLKKVTIPKSS